MRIGVDRRTIRGPGSRDLGGVEVGWNACVVGVSVIDDLVWTSERPEIASCVERDDFAGSDQNDSQHPGTSPEAKPIGHYGHVNKYRGLDSRVCTGRL